MSRFSDLRRFVRVDRGTAGIQRAVEDELQFHFDMTVRDLVSNGMHPDDARREAERRFGDVKGTRARLETIDRARAGQERRSEWWTAFIQDLRYAARGLRLKPGFAIAVIVTLGLGIGANAAMFGIVDRLLFRPPTFLTAPDRASRVYLTTTQRGKESTTSYLGHRRYLDLKENTTSFDAITPFYTNRLAIGSGDATREMEVAASGSDLWRMFDVKPVIGRFYVDAEDVAPNGTRVVVLSYEFWQTEFGGRRNILGTLMDIGPAKYTVIGVAPEGFVGFATEPIVGFIPHSAYTAADQIGGPGKDAWYRTYYMTWFEAFARRKPGVSKAAADADLSHAFVLSYKKQLETEPKNTPMALVKPRAIAGPVLADRGPNEGNDAKVATWLVGVAAIVLLIACANVANLLLARALKRRREIAVRIALGVSRGRLLSQLMTESVLLAVLGGVAGLALAEWGGAAMRRTLLDGAIVDSGAFADVRVLIVIALLALVAGLLTGIAPVFQTRREDVSAALKAGAREGTVQRTRLRAALLVSQAALSVVLLVGAGLFLRSLINVQHVRLGYDADRLLYVRLDDRGTTIDSVRAGQLRDQLTERARRIPGVDNASRGLTVPFAMTWQVPLFVTGIDSVRKLGDMTLQAGGSDLLATMGTRLLRGRSINVTDRAETPRVTVIGESMAKALWPSEDALGKCIRVKADTMPCTTVVGITEDVRRGSLSETQMHYYLPIEQFQRYGGGIFVRTHGPAVDKTDEVRRALQQMMPGSSYVRVQSMASILAPEIRSWRIGAIMFAVFGILALVLAAVGLYSVIAYNVTQRTHEMGVRVALGAQAADVIRLIVREGLRIVIPGVALGAIIALVAGKWVAPLLFNVSPKDPPVLVSVVLTLIAVAIAASWVPALRAAQVDPNVALRSD